jgi:hypothetical protein
METEVGLAAANSHSFINFCLLLFIVATILMSGRIAAGEPAIDLGVASQTKIERIKPPATDQGRSTLPETLRQIVESMAESVGPTNIDRQSLSPDRRKVAIHYRIPRLKQRFLVATESEGAVRPEVRDEVTVTDIAWMPDSSSLAFAIKDVTGPNRAAEVLLYNLVTRQAAPIVRIENSDVYHLAWHPRGTGLAFLVSDLAHIGDRMHGNLYLHKLGGQTIRLTQDFTSVSPAWSPSGQLLAVGNEQFVGRPKSEAGVALYSEHGMLVSKLPLRGRLGRVPEDLQVDTVRWSNDQQLLLRMSLFHGLEQSATHVSWYRISFPAAMLREGIPSH